MFEAAKTPTFGRQRFGIARSVDVVEGTESRSAIPLSPWALPPRSSENGRITASQAPAVIERQPPGWFDDGKEL